MSIPWQQLNLIPVLGARSIYANPEVLQALNPYWAVHFFLQYKTVSFIALGAVVLSITGVEALYADMGHFGKLPIVSVGNACVTTDNMPLALAGLPAASFAVMPTVRFPSSNALRSITRNTAEHLT